ncbi:MAG: DUF4863 family protein [Planctomycetes bacterium]|nr:DUF4863 family protein [Planctomycetota bacterium]
MSNDSIIEALKPVIARLKQMDLADTAAVRSALADEFPASGPVFMQLQELSTAGLREGWLCNREAGPSRFSRVAKADAADGFSIDAVLLWGDGPWHKHVKGEVNCMFAIEGEPEFCGFKPGWAVFPPQSAHVPTVQGGKMLILYLLPDGAVEWKR